MTARHSWGMQTHKTPKTHAMVDSALEDMNPQAQKAIDPLLLDAAQLGKSLGGLSEAQIWRLHRQGKIQIGRAHV